MRKIKLKELQEILNKESSNITLLNVLPQSAFEQEHIPKSINIPVDSPDFVQKVTDCIQDKHTPIVVYCAGTQCPASAQASAYLEDADFTNVMLFEEGMEAWKEAGKKIETGSQSCHIKK